MGIKYYILIFDIKRENTNLRKVVNRKLRDIGAEKIQHSVWKSESLKELLKIASMIKQKGSQVTILKEYKIY